MRKMCGIAGVVAALGALGGAASASAATIGPAGTAFTSANNGDYVIAFGSAVRLRCNAVRLSGTTPSPATSSTPFAVAFGAATGVAGSWCRLYVGSVPNAVNVAPSGNWTLNATTFNALTGASTGSIVTGGATTVTTSVGTCVITLPSGTTLPASGQNLVGGLTETLSASGLSFTATPSCAGFGVPTSGSYATSSGLLDISGLAVS
jgi:hypothetical protein